MLWGFANVKKQSHSLHWDHGAFKQSPLVRPPRRLGQKRSASSAAPILCQGGRWLFEQRLCSWSEQQKSGALCWRMLQSISRTRSFPGLLWVRGSARCQRGAHGEVPTAAGGAARGPVCLVPYWWCSAAARRLFWGPEGQKARGWLCGHLGTAGF